MKLKRLASSVATAALLAAMPMAIALPLSFAPTAAQAQGVEVSVNVFYDRLRPHGKWVRHERHRYVWCPAVDRDWRPYTRGRWIYLADRGWYFASDEPFAWAAYHYGRWYDDDRLGWCWVPGRTWAPAWVSWRRAPDYVGWAPLPPQGDGFSVSVEVNFGEPPEDDWFFVPVRSFLEPNLSVAVVYSERDPEIYRRAEPLGPVIIQNNIVINTVIDIDIIEQETGQEVEVAEAQPVDDPEAAGDADGATVPVFDEEIAEPAENEEPPEALDPEEAEAELGQPPEDGEEAPAEGEAAEEAPAEGETPAEGEAAPAEGEEAADEAPAEEAEEPAAPAEGEAVDCPEGQEAREGVCVAVEAEAGAEAPAEEAPAEEAPAEEAPAEEAPADEAPAEEAPAEQAPAEQAPAEEAPAEEAPAEQAPAPEQPQQQAPAAEQPAAPAQPPAGQPAACPEGQVPVDGACRPAG